MDEQETNRSVRLWAAVSALVAALLLHLFEITHYRFDSDEPQHLHVVWGWSNHLPQYRDVFDNHMPLFHLLMVPLLRVAGETSSVMEMMRWWMLPLYLISGLLTWIIARKSVGERHAIAAAALFAAFPISSLKGVEFRNDNLALPMVLVVVLLSLSRPQSRRRSFLIGLILGLTLLVSAKLLIAVLAWILVELFLGLTSREPGSRRDLAWRLGFAVAGVVIPILVLAAVFEYTGLLPSLYECVVSFNVGYPPPAVRRIGGLLLFLLFLGLVLRHLRRYRERGGALYPFLFALTFAVLLLAFWPIITSRDLLPFFPLLAVVVAEHLRNHWRANAMFAILILCELLAAVPSGHLLRARHDPVPERIADTLRLTRPGEYVMDLKGETVFRRRPYRFLLEHVGRTLIAQGVIHDTIIEDMLHDGCFVATANSKFWPPASRAFLLSHMIPVGILRVWGARPAPDGTFKIAAPGRYSLVNSAGSLARGGTIDGKSCDGVASLEPGMHRYSDAVGRPVTVIWSVAYERGFRPRG